MPDKQEENSFSIFRPLHIASCKKKFLAEEGKWKSVRVLSIARRRTRTWYEKMESHSGQYELHTEDVLYGVICSSRG
jgi:hypothetical protein